MTHHFYDFRRFQKQRLRKLFDSWNSHGGLHGLVLRKCAELLMGKTVLDVGCGGCHLYDLLQNKIKSEDYVGVDNSIPVLELAREKYPNLRIEYGDALNLSQFGMFDSVYAVGLYHYEPTSSEVLEQLIHHARKCVILTYMPKEDGIVNDFMDGKSNIETYQFGTFVVVRCILEAFN